MSDQAAQYPQSWIEFITPFANAIGKNVDEVTSALADYTGPAGDTAIALLRNPDDISVEDLRTALGAGVAKGVFNNAVRTYLRTVSVAAEAGTPGFANAAVQFGAGLLAAPTDEAWLTALQVGGVPKVDETSVKSLVKAGFADRFALYDLPSRIVDKMEDHAQTLDEQVTEDYWRLQKILTRRRNAEIIGAIEGGVGRVSVSAKAKKALLGRLSEFLWPATVNFYRQLSAWLESWQTQGANPALLFQAIASLSGGAGVIVPPGAGQPPPTETVRSAASGFITAVNKTFAGTGTASAAALAIDAHAVIEVLKDPALPAQVGASNHEHMLRILDVAVDESFVQQETLVTTFIINTMNIPKIPRGAQQEYAILGQLALLGSQINWADLEGPPARTPRRSNGGAFGGRSDDLYRDPTVSQRR